MTPRIQTDRLVLTPLSPADAGSLFAYRSLPEVARYQGWEPATVKDTVDFIAALGSIEFDSPGTWFQLGIRSRQSGDLIGDLGVHFLQDGEQVEIGFTLDPSYQGRGFGSEAVAGLLDHLFGTLRKHRVIASVDPRNTPSLRLLRRLGMRQEAHFIESVHHKGEWADDIVTAVLASEWVARTTGA
jgi:RimJ/RimL family protein N-acetyltransferase